MLYNTSRKLKVTGERPIAGGGSGRWARFLKSFPVSRRVNSGAIRAVMDKEQALLFVILPKGSGTQKEQQPGNHVPLPKDGGGTANADGSSGSGSSGSFLSAQEDVEKNRIEEKKMIPAGTKGKTQGEEVVATQDVGKTQGEEAIATQDVPITYGSAVANAIENDGDDGQTCKNKKWWQKIKPLHVVGFAVLILALVGVGALSVILLL